MCVCCVVCVVCCVVCRVSCVVCRVSCVVCRMSCVCVCVSCVCVCEIGFPLGAKRKKTQKGGFPYREVSGAGFPRRGSFEAQPCPQKMLKPKTRRHFRQGHTHRRAHAHTHREICGIFIDSGRGVVGKSPNCLGFPYIFMEQCKISRGFLGFRASLGGELFGRSKSFGDS